jgi:NAD(P)H-dependent FMN reductase
MCQQCIDRQAFWIEVTRRVIGQELAPTPRHGARSPAPLKNALDHLYKEWSGKPAIIVTYGGHRSDKCARQLRQMLKGLKMRPISTMPGFKLTHDCIKANTGTINPAVEFGKHRNELQPALVSGAKPRANRRSDTD